MKILNYFPEAPQYLIDTAKEINHDLVIVSNEGREELMMLILTKEQKAEKAKQAKKLKIEL